MPRHEGFREGFARLEAGGSSGGSENEPVLLGKAVDDAEAERQFGPDDRHVNLLALSESGERIGPRDVDWRDSGDRRNTGIPGGADDLGDVSLTGETGDKRMLARTAANHQNSHVVKRFRGVSTLHGSEGSGDYLVDLDGRLRLESAFTCASLAHLYLPFDASHPRKGCDFRG